MGANPWVVSVLRDGHTIPFKQRPLLIRSPLVLSGYANPTKSRFLKEALLNLRKVGSGESGCEVGSGLLLIYLFGVLRRFQHCTGHITTGSWKGRGNQYVHTVR